MEKVRIGNDIEVKYTVLRDGLPETFVGATDIVVNVKNEAYGKIIPSTFNIIGNIVNIILDAKDCVLCGKHRVTLSYNRGNDITIDSLAFELVQFTSQTGGTEIVGVEIVTVNISGDIGIAIPDNNKIDLDGLNSNIDKLHFKPDTLVALAEVGDVRYSQESKTLEVKVSDTVSIQLGQEMQTRVKNDAGVQIDNGQMVYIDSASGANPLAKIASTTDADIAQRTFGMATENIASNGFGAITTEGLVRDVNTAAFTEGDMLWLGINGAVTNIEPVAPTPKISVGMVLRSNVANGVIYVKIRAISRNQKLSDVYAPTLTGGDILRWNTTTLRFETFNVTTALAGKADLVGGKIPTSQLPAYVDDVLEYTNLAAFPATGETGKIYVALDTNLTYRWSGTAYIEISKSLALGETSSTAYRGDRGKTAYDHSQTTGNPHSTTAAQIPNTPAGTVAATTVQGAINELSSDIVQVETNLNEKTSNIHDNEVTKSDYILADPEGNIIFRVSSDGINVSKYNVLDSTGNILYTIDKSWFEKLALKILNIFDYEYSDDKFVLSDSSGNVIFMIDSDGVHANNINNILFNEINQNTALAKSSTKYEKVYFNESKLVGKNILAIGDSLTAANKWQLRLSDMLGANVYTHAMGGIGLTAFVDQHTSSAGTINALNQQDVIDKDVIVILGPYNDRALMGNIGVKSDIYPAQATLWGKMNYVFKRIYQELSIANNLTCKIYFAGVHAYGSYPYIEQNAYQEFPVGTGYTGADFAGKLKEICGWNGINYIDLFNNSGINSYTWNKFQASATRESKNYIGYVGGRGIGVRDDFPDYTTLELSITSKGFVKWDTATVVGYAGYYTFNGTTFDGTLNSSYAAWLADQLHCSQDGYNLIGNFIASKINEYINK